MRTRWHGNGNQPPVAPLLWLVIAEAKIDPAQHSAMAEGRGPAGMI